MKKLIQLIILFFKFIASLFTKRETVTKAPVIPAPQAEESADVTTAKRILPQNNRKSTHGRHIQYIPANVKKGISARKIIHGAL